MAKRGRHTEGFTLAELLMSVAIILILLPSPSLPLCRRRTTCACWS
ncbi:MAG: type II secretion system protein [Eggerthellaceae bacterium]